MKLISWNVNGLRASWDKGLFEFIEGARPDVLCLQEIKVQEHQLSEQQKNPLKYHSFWFAAEKPGYSGVSVYSKVEPISVINGIQIPEFDSEGRIIQLEYPNFVLLNAYFPNSQREHARLPYKLDFNAAIQKHCEGLVKKGKNIILCGDFNVAHKEIDLKNPKSNQKTAGFLPEERAWMDQFVEAGFVDSFREFNKEGGQYTWWSYRPGVREKNIGWRIDYHCINQAFKDRVKNSLILPNIKGSDHCPIELVVRD